MAGRSEKVLTDLFSEYIRRRAVIRCGGCERCGHSKHDLVKDNGLSFPGWKQLQAAHFIGRNAKNVKWDEDNAAGLCGGCHIHAHGHPLDFTEWIKNHLGSEVYNALIGRWRERSKPDISLLVMYYRQKIKELTNQS